jgi:hypothetical protein
MARGVGIMCGNRPAAGAPHLDLKRRGFRAELR